MSLQARFKLITTGPHETISGTVEPLSFLINGLLGSSSNSERFAIPLNGIRTGNAPGAKKRSIRLSSRQIRRRSGRTPARTEITLDVEMSD
jgi:hypothetical protein